MKKFMNDWAMVGLSAILGIAVSFTVARCGSASNATVQQYQQIEHLAKAAVNEGLLTNNLLMLEYNAVMPKVDLTSAVAGQVLANAATTLTAFYKGARALTLVPPHSKAFHDAGTSNDGAAAEEDYINTMVASFLPDVMLIETAGPIGYNANVCGTGVLAISSGVNLGAGAGVMPAPYLCGGRKLQDDTAGITVNFLLAADPTAATIASTVTYAGVGGNKQQGHTATTTTFPYLAKPY